MNSSVLRETPSTHRPEVAQNLVLSFNVDGTRYMSGMSLPVAEGVLKASRIEVSYFPKGPEGQFNATFKKGTFGKLERNGTRPR